MKYNIKNVPFGFSNGNDTFSQIYGAFAMNPQEQIITMFRMSFPPPQNIPGACLPVNTTS